MEITFCEYPSENELLRLKGSDDWPWLPRIGETIQLQYDKDKEDMIGIIRAIHWTSVGGFLNAVSIYIERESA